ncbi:MAG: anti-sigma factor, partial [Sphingomonadales bacterium]|nr:anti-sigma factor [Sphingomonadales bacterium]
APMLRLAAEAQTAHAVYAVEVAHPVEIAVTDDTAAEPHLMAWLSKRLGHPLAAPDLGAQGFTLIGGRLLPADQGPAAQLMYEDATGQRVTLYVAAMTGSETAFRFREGEDGTASLIWVAAGLGFALSGPMDREALWPLAEAAYHDLSL